MLVFGVFLKSSQDMKKVERKKNNESVKRNLAEDCDRGENSKSPSRLT
jgi:hypothetical protein